MKDFLKRAPAFHELEPLGDDQGHFLLGKPGAYYLAYRFASEGEPIEVPGDRQWKVDAIDPWGMEVWAVGSTEGGRYVPAPARQDLVYRLTPYAEGEPRRRKRGRRRMWWAVGAPLSVRFQSHAEGRVAWDFGDGKTSEDLAPSHRFESPGVYVVTLTGQ